MKTCVRAALAAAIGLGGAAALAQPAGGPVAVYWVSASTSTGMMGAMMGSGGAPDRAAMMRMAMGGGDPNAANHTLTLQLGSLRRADGAPEAEHDPPQGLGVGPALPLIGPAPTTAPPPAEEQQPGPPPQYRRPNGRMLIYWGCGEHAGPGQPVVFDFAKMTADPQAFAGMMRGLAVEPMRPPSPGRFPSFGEWPNRESSVQVPAEGSLVGDHVVKSNYTPAIRFSLGPDQDFMAPLQLVSNTRTPSGAVRLAWNPVPTALGYFATVMGAVQDNTVVIWTSSASQAAAFVLPDYLPPSETRRLVADGHLMGPERTECVVPQEVASQAHGLVQLAAYGDEANFDYPPRPASPQWAVKVRYRSTTSGLLGQPNPFGGGRPPYGQQQPYGQQDQQQQQPPQQQGGFGAAVRGLGGFIP